MVDSQRGAYPELAITISYPTSANGVIVLLKTPKDLQYLSSPAVFVDAYRLPYLWSMVYELIYHCLLTNQNSGIAICHCLFLIKKKIIFEIAITNCSAVIPNVLFEVTDCSVRVLNIKETREIVGGIRGAKLNVIFCVYRLKSP